MIEPKSLVPMRVSPYTYKKKFRSGQVRSDQVGYTECLLNMRQTFRVSYLRFTFSKLPELLLLASHLQSDFCNLLHFPMEQRTMYSNVFKWLLNENSRDLNLGIEWFYFTFIAPYLGKKAFFRKLFSNRKS